MTARVRTIHQLWRCVPCGTEVLEFFQDECEWWVDWRSQNCCWLCCGPRRLRLAACAAQVGKQPLCNTARLIRDGACSFVVALLFHLIPAIIWGAERSLGSSQNHQLLGLVWFGGWPVWFVVLQLLRPWGLHVRRGECGCHNDCTALFIPFQSYSHAHAVAAFWSAPSETQPPAATRLCDPWMCVGLCIWTGLWANAIFTGIRVIECSNRGCCKDDASTLDACVATGYP